MRYEGMVYRPPSEAGSLIIQATVGCPHNKCTFCAMYKGSRFKIRPVAAVKEDLEMARDYYGPGVRSVFFADGNTIIMKTRDLVEIFTHARQVFPHLERITLYGSARFILRKSLEELVSLREAGLKRIHSGLESGDDEVLAFLKKGVTADQAIEAGRRVMEAGIELSEYYIVGAGGVAWSRQHAVQSARVLNAINPDFIRLRTMMPARKAPLYDMFRDGSFVLLRPHQALRETRVLLEHLEGVDSWLLSDHVSNYWPVNGKLPGDREKMLKAVDEGLALGEDRFRHPETVRL
jgi:radical SAM superfamily enzyme YgiQ (UPF0313 family)